MSQPPLHTSWVRSSAGEPSSILLMLHGILGSGQNLRSVATRLVQADPSIAALLVDLRLHGRSQGFSPPHTVTTCAEDLLRLSEGLPHPVSQVLGHSFGGKVALRFHALRPDLSRVMLLDSSPGSRTAPRGSEQTFAILSLLDQLPRTFAQRDDFLRAVRSHGQSSMIAEWLAMNLERTSDGSVRLRLDVQGIREMLSDYFALDAWSVLETSSARWDVVIGGRSEVLSFEDKQHLAALAQHAPERFHVHQLERAGHWLHVDDFEGLCAALGAGRDQSSETP